MRYVYTRLCIFVGMHQPLYSPAVYNETERLSAQNIAILNNFAGTLFNVNYYNCALNNLINLNYFEEFEHKELLTVINC